MRKVAILDGQTIQAISIAKSLSKEGYYIILICENKYSYGYYTKYANEKIIAPSTKNNTGQFHQFFLDFLKYNNVDIVIPMNDYSANYLSLNKNQLKQYANFIIPDYPIFMTAYDKNKLMKICYDNNFPHPKTFDLKTKPLAEIHQNIRFPAIIKPNITTGARGFSIIYSTDELEKKLPSIVNAYGACHLQEFIPEGGKQFKVEIFIQNQSLINATVIHKIRFYPEKGGSSCYNKTIVKDDLIELCFNILKTIQWEGFADFDLIEDPRDGIIKVMEINPRVPACINASLISGVNFAENIASVSLGLPPTKYIYTPGYYLRYLGLDLLWFIKSKNKLKISSSWFKCFFNSKHFLQDGNFDDPKPFIFGTLGGIIKQLNPRFRAEKKI